MESRIHSKVVAGRQESAHFSRHQRGPPNADTLLYPMVSGILLASLGVCSTRPNSYSHFHADLLLFTFFFFC